MRNESLPFIKTLFLVIFLTGTMLFLDTAQADDLVFLVADLQFDAASSNPAHFVTFQDTLFFAATTGDGGTELWKSNGTEMGTTRVRDIYVGAGSSNPAHLTVVDDTLFFVATTAFDGIELWRSDGTESGTVLVKDINAQGIGADSYPDNLTAVNDTLFFTATDDVSGVELWKSDGTESGTQLVKDIRPGSADANPTHLTAVEDTLFFTVDDGMNGVELWKSDGTEAGTQLVKDINASGSSNPTELIEMDDTLFFRADDGLNGIELWKSDGSEAGTVLVKDIFNDAPSSIPTHLTKVDNHLFFTANDGVYGFELWQSDGTEEGTTLVKDIRSGNSSSGPADLIEVNDTLFFRANDGTNGRELWKSDGSETGTVLINDIHPLGNSTPVNLTKVNELLFFSADNGITGTELWRSDGTEEGTFQVEDIRPGEFSSNPNNLTAIDDILFFSANNGTYGTELWALANPSITATAIADVSNAEVGQTITYTYWITNSGNIHLNDIRANDEKRGIITLDKTTLHPGEKAIGTSTYTVSSDDIPSPLTNSVYISGAIGTTLDINVTKTTSINLIYSAIAVDSTASTNTAGVGQTIVYTYRITNTGNIDLIDIRANDNKLGIVLPGQVSLRSGEHLIKTASYTIKPSDLPGPLTNIVTVIGYSETGSNVSDTANGIVTLTQDTSSPRVTKVYLPAVRKDGIKPTTKKGVGIVSYTPACEDLAALNAHWYLNWTYFADPTCGPDDAEKFVPRIYNADSMQHLPEAIEYAKASGWLMGFSEPNLPWQGDVSPAQGAILWKQIEEAADSADIKLVSPSPNQWEPDRDGLPYGHQWLWAMVDEYQTRYGKKPRFDAIAWNIYRPTPAETIAYLTARHNEMVARGYDVPVWILEYGGRCWNSSGETGNEAIMNEVTAWFETTPWIGRYAWFANRLTGSQPGATNYQSCSLIDYNTGRLTPLGQIYSEY